MKYYLSKRYIVILVVILIVAPIVVLAVKIPDPINAENPTEVWARLIKGFLGIIGTFALMNFVLAGFGMVWSRGNEEKIKKHQENIKWTLLGIIFLFGSYAIISYVLDKLAGATGVG